MTARTARKRRDALVAGLEHRAEEAAGLLAAMANPKRLMVLCNLLDGERAVGDLAEQVGLRQAALSQHLAKMRALGLVATRRDGQTIYYRLASREVREILQTLYGLYCA
ncbi:ArsR/SmtB family transcription factor [Bradyrhizobium sp. HKCCYLS20291]|uniref:ArsR/SmtB family transcription factor n=1 Tax=Bradyrhizobium sp. HKCCYLS20291 TaxID=3420766 RepID=UPI003EB7F8F8